MKKISILILGLSLVLGLSVKASAYDYIHFDLWDQYHYCQIPNPDYDPNDPLSPPILYGQTPFNDTALFVNDTVTNNILYVIKNSISYYTYGYALGQYVSQATVRAAMPDNSGELSSISYDNDARQLFNVVSKSDSDYDSFTNRSKFLSLGYYNPDLAWDEFATGFLLDATEDPSDATKGKTGRIHFVPSIDGSGQMIKMYNTKWAADLYLLRKIDLIRNVSVGTDTIPSKVVITSEVGVTTSSYVNDDAYYAATGKRTTQLHVVNRTVGSYSNVNTIVLSEFITQYISEVPGDNEYEITLLDGNSYTLSWMQMQYSYYLPDYDLIYVAGGAVYYYPASIQCINLDDETEDIDDLDSHDPPGYAVIP